MTALFDDFMNGINCVTSEYGWKWDDVIRSASRTRWPTSSGAVWQS
jgi:hypothetical protein